MTKIELGELISRIFALYCLIRFLVIFAGLYFPYVVGVVFSSDSNPIRYAMSNFLGNLSYLILFAIFWWKANFIGRKVMGQPEDIHSEKVVTSMPYKMAVSCAFMLGGIFMLSLAVPKFVHVTFNLYYYLFLKEEFQNVLISFENIFAFIIFMFFAVYFLFGGKSLKQMIINARTKGVDVQIHDNVQRED